jgi:hypothetical protein
VQEFLDTINNTQRVFTRSANNLSSATPDELVELETEIGETVDQLSDIPSIAEEPDRISQGLLEVMQNQYSLLQDVRGSGTMTFGYNDRAQQNMRRFTILMDDLNDWVQREGADYGIVLRRP